jgi:uncharacterized membrane protein
VHLRRTLLSGILLLVPTVATVWVLSTLFRSVDALLGPWLTEWTGREIPGLGFLATFALVYVLGLLASNVVGKRVFALWDQFVTRVPLVRGVYRVTKEVSQAFGSEKKPFREVVAVEFPRKGVWTLGFLTADAPAGSPVPEGSVFVFIPTTPNPTSGWLILVPRAEALPTPYSVDEGMRLIISAGIVGSPAVALK